MTAHDRHDLERFLAAQEPCFATVLAELHSGRKETHWMWFIFPQLAGLGRSPMAVRFSLGSAAEAAAYLRHPVLGQRLRQCTSALLAIEGRTADEIMGKPDDLKLRSCMTLFDRVAAGDQVFRRVLDKYFEGGEDPRTIELLGPIAAL